MSVPTGLPHRVRVYCSACGGTNVRRDAWAVFDEATQQWELGEVFDDGYCVDCDRTGGLSERRLDEPEPERRCCGNCRLFERLPDGPRVIAGEGTPDGRCGLKLIATQHKPYRRATDWCIEHIPMEKGSTT